MGKIEVHILSVFEEKGEGIASKSRDDDVKSAPVFITVWPFPNGVE
jgi:hypothetical protein